MIKAVPKIRILNINKICKKFSSFKLGIKFDNKIKNNRDHHDTDANYRKPFLTIPIHIIGKCITKF